METEKWRKQERKGTYRRAYTDLTKGEAERQVKKWKEKEPKVKLTVRKDPNGRYEVWVKAAK